LFKQRQVIYIQIPQESKQYVVTQGSDGLPVALPASVPIQNQTHDAPGTQVSKQTRYMSQGTDGAPVVVQSTQVSKQTRYMTHDADDGVPVVVPGTHVSKQTRYMSQGTDGVPVVVPGTLGSKQTRNINQKDDGVSVATPGTLVSFLVVKGFLWWQEGHRRVTILETRPRLLIGFLW